MGSIFASQTQRTVALPFDSPHTVTIRKLTGQEVERAQFEHLSNFVGGRGARGWSARFQQLLATGKATDADAVSASRDPLVGYDRLSVVKAGLVAWTYSKEITLREVEDLDDETLEFLALDILKLTKPALFESAEDAQKKAHGLSSSSRR